MSLFRHKAISPPQLQVIIDRPVSEVWRTLIDINAWGRWNPVIRHSVIYGPALTGTAFKCISQEWDFQCVIDEALPESRLTVSGTSIGVRLMLTWNLNSESDMTSVTLSSAVAGWIPSIFSKRATNRLQLDLSIWLNALKNRLERPDQGVIERPSDDDDEIDDSRPATVFKTINFKWFQRKGSGRGRHPLK